MWQQICYISNLVILLASIQFLHIASGICRILRSNIEYCIYDAVAEVDYFVIVAGHLIAIKRWCLWPRTRQC